MKVLIMGNSGSGKSTLAARLARESKLAHLDLDTLAWLPGMPPQRAPLAESMAKIEEFVRDHDSWVIEGCYGDLIEGALRYATRLVFLNPGTEACVANCRARPWEPHKYETKAAQDANLDMLIEWVRGYETRDDDLSLGRHRALFESFRGDKIEITE